MSRIIKRGYLVDRDAFVGPLSLPCYDNLANFEAEVHAKPGGCSLDVLIG